MNFWKFNNTILLTYAVFSIILIVVFFMYLGRITVFEDIEIRLTDSSYNSEMIFVTPLNKEYKLEKGKSGTWITRNMYARRIYLKFQNDSININEINLFINNKQMQFNPGIVRNMNGTVLIDIPYTSQQSFSKKLSYILVSNFQCVSKVYSFLLFIIGFVILCCFLLFISLDKKSKTYIIRQAKKLFCLCNIKNLSKNTVFQVLMFFALWLTLILITIFKN